MAVRFRFPYGQAQPGYWGLETSTIDWCEENYAVTHYCAEPVNTITNLVFIYLGVKGMRNCVRAGLPPIFVLAYVGYMIVGLGSTAFHASLKCSSHTETCIHCQRVSCLTILPRLDAACGRVTNDLHSVLCSFRYAYYWKINASGRWLWSWLYASPSVLCICLPPGYFAQPRHLRHPVFHQVQPTKSSL
jgi:hypothetical protein